MPPGGTAPTPTPPPVAPTPLQHDRATDGSRGLVALALVAAFIVVLGVGLSWALSARHSTPQSQSASPTHSQATRNTPPTLEPIQIAALPQVTSRVTSISGTGDIPQGEHLRVFVYAPEAKFVFIDGDASVTSPHHWTASPVYLGSADPSDNGQTFTIYALLINDATDAAISNAQAANPNVGYAEQQWEEYFARLPGASTQATRSNGSFALPMIAAPRIPSLTDACQWQYGDPNAIATDIPGSDPTPSYTVRCLDGSSDIGGLYLDTYCNHLVSGMRAYNPDRYGSATDQPPPWEQWECAPG